MLHIIADCVEGFECLVVKRNAEVFGSFADLLKIDRRMADLGQFDAALAVRNRFELRPNDMLGVGVRRCADQRFLREQQHTGVEIANRRNISIMILLTKIFDAHTDRCNRVFEE